MQNIGVANESAAFQAKKKQKFREIDIFGAMRTNPGPKKIGDLLGPRKKAKIAGPPYAPFIAHHLHGPPWAPQHPIRRKVKKAGKGHQRRNGGRRAFLSTGQLALHYLRYITAGEVANALPKFGDREPGPYCGIGRCTECGGSFQVRKRSKRRWGTPLARACLCGRFSRGTC